MKSRNHNVNSAAKPNKEPKLSRTHIPVDISPLEWQRALRRQFGREQVFGLENTGGEIFFSENPAIVWQYGGSIRAITSVHAPITPPMN